MRKSFGIAIFVALFVVMSGAWAGTVSVTVQDADFSTPACTVGNICGTGAYWVGVGGNGHGVQTAAGVYTPGTYPTLQFGFANTGDYLEQVLSTNLAASTTYTLTVVVSDQAVGDTFGPIVELLAGGTIVAQATAASPNGNTIPPANGIVETWTLTYTSGASVTAGQALAIYLGSTTTQSDYTNVSLTATTSGGGGGGVPEPAVFALVGAGLLGLVARRRFVK
jgi:hypothetical protein